MNHQLHPPDKEVKPGIKSPGWVKAMRTEAAFELMKASPSAYILAINIAFRARWSDGFNQHRLAIGEALLGDFKSYGMSEQEYRTAKQHLFEWGFATFKSTNKGTVGKLTDSRLFEVSRQTSNGQNNRRATDSQRTSNERATTNKYHKEERKKKEDLQASSSSCAALPPAAAPMESSLLPDFCREEAQ
jgi:hypothetical protein